MSFADTERGHDFRTMSQTRQRLVPHLNDLHASILRLLPKPRDEAPYRVLDIGTGLVVERVLNQVAGAEVHIVHAEQVNLDAAQDRLSEYADQVTYELGDYGRMPLEGPYDVIIQELEANFLENKSKRTLLSAAYAALRRGGRLISIAQVRGATQALEDRYVEQWKNMAREQGASEDELDHAIFTTSKGRTATLAQQLDWMAGDGFENVDCYVKYWRLAVIAGDKL
ncbi:MAG: class I SAM-dependent methyltransferase [Alphaproteobacteria bacterium]|jgi:tRNA (cmo5U34)-methyltransferase|nr:class I SAM-dependent methyltransferase [Alphaproteobacteria bacterium]